MQYLGNMEVSFGSFCSIFYCLLAVKTIVKHATSFCMRTYLSLVLAFPCPNYHKTRSSTTELNLIAERDYRLPTHFYGFALHKKAEYEQGQVSSSYPIEKTPNSVFSNDRFLP